MSGSLSSQYADYIIQLLKNIEIIEKDVPYEMLRSNLSSLLDEYELMLNKRGSELFQPETLMFNLEKKQFNNNK